MPRVEYTLSFENYLEMTQDRREKPQYRAAAISALLGMSSIAFGYTYLKIWPETQSFIGGLFLALGLLATGLALVLAILARPKSSRPPLKTLRWEYEQSNADTRAIDFDENGWRVLWYEGEDVRPWSCLTAVYDQETLLILATETTHYWLPKKALEESGHLALLRELADHALTNRELCFTVPLRPSAAVYIAASLFDNWRRNFKANLLAYATALLGTYWLLFAGWNSTPPPLPWLLAIPSFFLSCQCLQYCRKFIFEYRSRMADSVEIRSDSLYYKTARVQWILRYRRLRTCKETPFAFLLYFEPKAFHLIPKRGFSKEQLLRFKKLLSAFVTAP